MKHPDNEKYPVRLMFPNKKGKFVEEYIPKELNWVENKIAAIKYNYAIRHRTNNLYYWDFLNVLTPRQRKVFDLHFILHCIEDHSDYIYEDRRELQYFLKVGELYHDEAIMLIRDFDNLSRRDKHSKHPRLQSNPYLRAYRKQWLDTYNLGPNFKLFYHGVGLDEALDLLDVLTKDNIYVARTTSEERARRNKAIDIMTAKHVKRQRGIEQGQAQAIKELKQKVKELEQKQTTTNKTDDDPQNVKITPKATAKYKTRHIANFIFWISNVFITAILTALTARVTHTFDYIIGPIIMVQMLLLPPYFLAAFIIYQNDKKHNQRNAQKISND